MQFPETFRGYIKNMTDTLLIIEACRYGILPTISRRLLEKERNSITSGTIIVFDESESGIKRWTDGLLWSPSRILGNFLVYRELKSRENRKKRIGKIDLQDQDTHTILRQEKEKALVGSLTTSNTIYNFKEDGLIKKTIRLLIDGKHLHIINYYNKNDVLNNLLQTPSSSPQLTCLQISPDLMLHLPEHMNDYHQASRKRSSSYCDNNRPVQEYKRRMYSYDATTASIPLYSESYEPFPVSLLYSYCNSQGKSESSPHLQNFQKSKSH
ncbi:Gti1/Pac2 family-domain-containing protein, partial [Blakeslea trispora]